MLACRSAVLSMAFCNITTILKLKHLLYKEVTGQTYAKACQGWQERGGQRACHAALGPMSEGQTVCDKTLVFGLQCYYQDLVTRMHARQSPSSLVPTWNGFQCRFSKPLRCLLLQTAVFRALSPRLHRPTFALSSTH